MQTFKINHTYTSFTEDEIKDMIWTYLRESKHAMGYVTVKEVKPSNEPDDLYTVETRSVRMRLDALRKFWDSKFEEMLKTVLERLQKYGV